MRNIKVHIRTKVIKGERESIRLDYSPPILNPETGKQQRFEYLGLYLYQKPRTMLERRHNKDTKDLAESIRAERQLAVQRGQFGFLQQKDKNTNFIEYFDQLIEEKEVKSKRIWLTASNHLKEVFGPSLLMSNINVAACNKFRSYLLSAKRLNSNIEASKRISRNSAAIYLALFRSGLRKAYSENYLDTDIAAKIEPITKQETHRNFLTLEELQQVARTPCSDPVVKQAALFSALTGLRFSDIYKLTWQEVQRDERGYYLQFFQKKTERAEVMPIPEQARELLGEQGKANERVFKGLRYTTMLNLQIREWLFDAGINKKFTFHCFRHTYATLQLSLGTDIYTVSKMLGHRNLKTTQVYAKIVDEKKREAADKIKLDL